MIVFVCIHPTHIKMQDSVGIKRQYLIFIESVGEKEIGERRKQLTPAKINPVHDADNANFFSRF